MELNNPNHKMLNFVNVRVSGMDYRVMVKEIILPIVEDHDTQFSETESMDSEMRRQENQNEDCAVERTDIITLVGERQLSDQEEHGGIAEEQNEVRQRNHEMIEVENIQRIGSLDVSKQTDCDDVSKEDNVEVVPETQGLTQILDCNTTADQHGVTPVLMQN